MARTTRQQLKDLGATEYRIKTLRVTQKELPEINELIYETSLEEVTAYELGGLTDEDILVEFKHQNQFSNINDFIKARINNIKAEKQTVEQTGRTLNFINNLADYEAALPNYTAEEIMNMSRQERIGALAQAFHDIYGTWSKDSDEVYLLNAILA